MSLFVTILFVGIGFLAASIGMFIAHIPFAGFMFGIGLVLILAAVAINYLQKPFFD
tara:strand:+ start:526 stop:693 length:168 start_codon:yes stop_codon:yes gene_type:complete